MSAEPFTTAARRVELRLRSIVCWDERGILLNAPRRAVASDRPWSTQGLRTIALPWADVARVEDTSRWPNLVVEADERTSGRTRYAIELAAEALDVDAAPTASAEQAGAHAHALLEYVRMRHPRRVAIGGWATYPDIAWEPVLGLPGEVSRLLSAGPFRGPASRKESVRARWERAGLPLGRAVGRMLDRLAPRMTDHYAGAPDAIVVTDEHVYVRRRHARARLPLGALRELFTWAQRDEGARRLAVFGRRARILLEEPEQLDVIQAVRDRLAPVARSRV